MHKKLLLSIILSFLFNNIFSQTFTGGGGPIPDDGTSVDFTLPVSTLPNSIDTTSFGLETVCINVTHTWDADLDISLIAPDGTNILLTSANGGGGHDYTNTCFDNSAPTSIALGSPPFTGTFRPQGDLGLINNNQNPNGTWTLHIHDTYPFADQGNLLSWNITFGNNPAVPVLVFMSSNLPIIVIHSSSPIPDEPKIMADMGIIYNGVSALNHLTDSFNNYNGKIGIEIRGSSSQSFPKKGYGFETWDTAGVEINASLLGMPPESDWILSASYSDKTLMHNVLAYKLFRDMGHYAPRTVYCELILNGQYMGVYMLMEKIKRDNNRVHIAHLGTTENSGIDLTGGYIIKIDKTTGNGGAGWTSPYPPVVSSGGQVIYFQYEYPDPDSITPQQQTYIQQYVDSFEDALVAANFADTINGYRKYCDENSFIDYFILNEVSRNVDGLRLSTFLYKDKIDNPGGGKLVMGPPWDYDIAWHNVNYCNGDLTVGWAVQFGSVCPGDGWQIPTWWSRMLQDIRFRDNLKCRWNELRQTVLSDTAITNWIDTTAAYLNTGQTRNFIEWPILGAYVWPNPSPIPLTYAGEITDLKSWILARLNWLDNFMPGNLNCIMTGMDESALNSPFTIYPNPATTELRIKNVELRIEKVEIYNLLGEKVHSQSETGNQKSVTVSVADFLPGVYFVRVMTDKNIFSSKIIVSK